MGVDPIPMVMKSVMLGIKTKNKIMLHESTDLVKLSSSDADKNLLDQASLVLLVQVIKDAVLTSGSIRILKTRNKYLICISRQIKRLPHHKWEFSKTTPLSEHKICKEMNDNAFHWLHHRCKRKSLLTQAQ